MLYNLTNRDGVATLALIGTTVNQTIAASHPKFAEVVDYLTSNDVHDEAVIERLIDPAKGIAEVLSTVTDRLVYRSNNLFFDGVALHNALGRQILARLEAGDDDWERFVRFLINLDGNPSYRAQQALFTWIDSNGLTITPDGYLIGYKGVSDDGYSLHSGPNNYINGVLLGEPGVACKVPHNVGDVISKKRADVDDNPGLACSTGLHVGTREYAEDFAPRLLTVEFSPADVVSIPSSDLDFKIRVCRYKVLELADPRAFDRTSYNPGEYLGVKTEERRTREADLEALDAEDRASYERFRQQGRDHHDALEAVFDGECDYVEDDEPVFDVEGEDVEDNYLTDEEGLAGEEPAAGEVAGGPSPDLTLAENAALVADLKADLENTSLGHKPLARKWSHLTTEASVRRYRKSQGISISLGAKIKDGLS